MKIKKYETISVIVPCFNSGKTLKRTIDSIKNQSWLEKEIILVNDGSNEKYTLEILQSFKNDSLIKIINQENKGLSSARNIGVNCAKGTYLFFLDSDDWIDKNTLEELYLSLKNENFFAYIFTDSFLEGETKGIRKKEFNLFEQMFINHIPYSIFIKKKTFIENGFYDEKMKLGYEDWELNIRLASRKLYGKRLAKPLFHYNVANSGMLISRSIQNHIKIWRYIRLKNEKLYNFKNIIFVFYKWSFKKYNYPLLIVFIWYLMMNYLPESLVLRVFLISRKIKYLFKS